MKKRKSKISVNKTKYWFSVWKITGGYDSSLVTQSNTGIFDAERVYNEHMKGIGDKALLMYFKEISAEQYFEIGKMIRESNS